MMSEDKLRRLTDDSEGGAAGGLAGGVLCHAPPVPLICCAQWRDVHAEEVAFM